MSYEHLNPRQIEAITAKQGPVLVLAGAGSGKTTVLIERVAYLIETCGLAPWSILAITFTKKAAGELQARLSRQLGTAALDVWALTFHATCARMLRRDIDKIGYGKDFTVYDSDDSGRVLKSCIKDMNLDDKQYPYRAIISAISRAKNAEVAPEQYAQTFGDQYSQYRMQKEADLYAMYCKRLKVANALDFDDLLLLTVRLFREHPDVLAYYQNKFKAMLVDEYQDTNGLQYRFCSLLAQKHRSFFVVGDDDQSIYRFRGATIENILSFNKQYADAQVIRLEQNYRSTQNILTAANGIIEHNQGRTGKTLWTEMGSGALIHVFQASTDSEESAYVSDTIREQVRQGAKYNDFAILYRMNAQANQLEDILRRRNIPYRIIGGTRFFDRAEIRDVLAYLQVLNNPMDDLRLTRIINVPTRGIGLKTVETVALLAEEQGLSMSEILDNLALYPDLNRSLGSLSAFWSMIAELRAQVGRLPLTELYDLLIEKTGYLRTYQAKNDVESEGRIENVLELKSTIAKYEEDNEEPTLGGFLENVALAADVENYDADADAVVLMTIHSAKGLEFPTVFMVGLEEGLFPGMRSIGDPQEIEEERRLCYVAVTRARKELHITCATSRMLFGRTSYNMKSRFLDELPGDCIEQVKREVAEAPKPRIQSKVGIPKSSVGAAAKPVTGILFATGDTVEHKAFGKGLVTKTSPMGGDALLEIAFEGVGTKRLMLKSAVGYLKKV